MFRRGGSIVDTKGLRHILSIGYEVECGVLVKFTRTEIDIEPGEMVLYNTDTARKDVDDFKRLEEDPDADVDDYILERQEEIMEDVVFDRAGNLDKNAVFNITSDISVTPFIKMVDKNFVELPLQNFSSLMPSMKKRKTGSVSPSLV